VTDTHEARRRLLIERLLRRAARRWDTCGAYARTTGRPCQAPGNGRGGRCKLHGGKSTGPRTPEGVERLRQAMKRRWRAWRRANRRKP
jgi:hypothetical protein